MTPRSGPTGALFYKQCSLAGGSLVLRLVARSLDPGAAQLSLCANGDRGRLHVRMRNLRHLIGLVIETDIHRDIPVRATLLLLAVLLPYAGLGLLLLRWHAGGIYDRPLRRWQHVRYAEPARIDLRIRERNAIVREGVATVHGRNAAAAATTKQLLWVGAPGAHEMSLARGNGSRGKAWRAAQRAPCVRVGVRCPCGFGGMRARGEEETLLRTPLSLSLSLLALSLSLPLVMWVRVWVWVWVWARGLGASV